VVLLTSFAEAERVIEALAAGGIGYQLKGSDPVDLMPAVRAAAAGDAPLDPRLTRALLPGAAPPAASAVGDQLSPRETRGPHPAESTACRTTTSPASSRSANTL
jgi:DNA-binding NarL/FixJ family response regulator